MSKKKNNKPKPLRQRYTLSNAVLNYFLLVMFVLFPLFVTIYADGSFPFIHFDNGFYSIRHQKYHFFLIMTALAAIAEVMLLVTKSVSKNDKTDISKGRSFLESITFTDWAALGLLVSCAISTVFSEYTELAFWGETSVGSASRGRNNGLFLILFYLLAYFLITRCYRYAEYVFTGLAVSCGIVYLLTVLNGYYIDPLNMFAAFKNGQNVYMEFFSTIGNKNMLSSFICATLPVIFTMSVYSKSLVRRIIYLCSTALGAMAIIIGDSDSAVLGVGVFLSVYLILYIRNTARLKKYFLALTVMLGSVKLLRLFSLLMNDNYKKLGDITSGILFSGAIYAVIAISLMITVALYLLDSKKPAFKLPKAVPVALFSLLAAAAVGLAGTMVYFSAINKEADLGGLEKLLRMNDAWGTHRGIMWLRSFDIFGDAPFFQKLFGTGPDTFYFAFRPYFSQLEQYGNTSTDAAHNEYINYLITIGIVGLAAYLAFVGGALTRAFKAAKQNPLALVFASAVICYAVQAVVNIAVPISTPLFIIFVSLCEAAARQELAKQA